MEDQAENPPFVQLPVTLWYRIVDFGFELKDIYHAILAAKFFRDGLLQHPSIVNRVRLRLTLYQWYDLTDQLVGDLFTRARVHQIVQKSHQWTIFRKSESEQFQRDMMKVCKTQQACEVNLIRLLRVVNSPEFDATSKYSFGYCFIKFLHDHHDVAEQINLIKLKKLQAHHKVLLDHECCHTIEYTMPLSYADLEKIEYRVFYQHYLQVFLRALHDEVHRLEEQATQNNIRL